jgi:Ca2+-binding RTX toxin-like protein
MAQLTGNFQGTAAADTFSGSIANNEQTVENGVATGIAIKQVIIDTFAGVDTIFADTKFAATPFLAANAIGMTNADISTGGGADKVAITSNGNSFKATTSTGLQNSLIETDADSDTITISSTGTASFAGGSVPATSTGIRLATLSAGNGNDTLQVTSFTKSSPAEGRGQSTDTGIDQSTLLGGAGQDSITLKSEAIGSSDFGADVISTGAKGSSRIEGGTGNDRITVNALGDSGTSITRASTATVKGISEGTIVEGGAGDDVIALSASANAKFGITTNTGGAAKAYGATDAFVYGRAGSDSIQISGKAESAGTSPESIAYGVLNSTVDGGSENDRIEIKALGSPAASNGTYHGAAGSSIYGGIGSDTIDISVSEATNVKASVGALSSTLDAGADADTVKIRGLKFDLQDSLIMGGDGNDTLDTGIGSSTVLGGGGTDLFKLDFFNADTMTIEQQGADGIKITGTLDKTGAAASWSQNIFEVESYEVAGTVYNATGVVSLLG